MAIVTAVGIDQNADKTIELSIQIIVPQTLGGGPAMGGGGSAGGGKVIEVRVAKGVSVADARARVQEKLSRTLFWSHAKAIVIGEEAAKQGISGHLDFFARHNQTRLRTMFFVSKGKAVNIVNKLTPIEKYSGEALRELTKLQFGMEVTLKQLLQMLNGNSEAAALPWIELAPAEPGEDTEKLHLDGAAILKKDKMIGHMDARVTRGLLWIRDEIKLATLTFTPKEAEGGHMSLKMLRSGTQLIPQIHNGQWKMTIKSVTEDDIIQNTTKLNPMNPKILKQLEQEASENLENRIELALKRVQQEYKADVLGFAEAFHRKYPKEWSTVKNQWDEVFPDIKVEVDAKVYIRRPGASTAPAGVPEEEVKNK